MSYCTTESWLSLMHEVGMLRVPLVFGRAHGDITLSENRVVATKSVRPRIHGVDFSRPSPFFSPKKHHARLFLVRFRTVENGCSEIEKKKTWNFYWICLGVGHFPYGSVIANCFGPTPSGVLSSIRQNTKKISVYLNF